MYKRPRPPQGKLSPKPAQQMNRQNQPNLRVAQPKLATSGVVQPKLATPAQQQRRPVAPAVYRPQPVPKVLQRKMAIGQPQQQKPEPGRAPAAPPVYRPQPRQPQTQPRTAVKVTGANALQAKAAAPTAQRSTAHQPQGRTEKLRMVERPSAQRFHAPPQSAVAQPKNPANISSLALTPGQLRAAQLKQIPAPPSVGRPTAQNSLIQAKWEESENDGLESHRLVDKVQWHKNLETGQIFYEDADDSMIKLGNQQHHRANDKKWFDRQGVMSADSFSPANVDKSLHKDVIHTSALKASNIHSNFKDFFEINGKLLAVFKAKNSSSLVEKEVEALNNIASKGFTTPNAKVVTVIHKNEMTKGILMDKVQGTFVDMAKVSDISAITSILDGVARGQSVDVSEANLVNLRGPQVNPRNKPVVDAIIKDLSALLAKQETIAINDLQFIVKPNGQLVIIDPQWAGDKKTLVSSQEQDFINKTYERILKVKEQLEKDPKQAPPQVSSYNKMLSISYGRQKSTLDLFRK